MAGSDPYDSAGARRRPRGGFDPTSIDLTDFDVERLARSAAATTEQLGGRVLKITREATYIAVGLGVLGVQRAQVRRREFERRFR